MNSMYYKYTVVSSYKYTTVRAALKCLFIGVFKVFLDMGFDNAS